MWPASSKGGVAPSSTNLSPTPLRMVDLRKLAFALADSAGRPRLLGAPCLRAVHWVGTSILMSTRCGELLHLDYARSSEMPDVTLLLNGHCHTDRMPSPLRTHGAAPTTDGACPSGSHGALACHPSLPLLASTAADITLRLWDIQQRQMEGMRMLPAAACDLAFAPTSDTLVCALGDAGLLVLDATGLHDILTLPLGVGSGGACALSFAPDGALLAVGTDRGAIELRAAGGMWEVLGSCGIHPSPLVAIDWSDDGAALQSECVSGIHLFWDARTCAQLDASDAVQFGWASASCPNQWALAGVPEILGYQSLLAATRRANGGSVVACAGADGAITLVGYPTTSPDAAALRYADSCAALRSLAWTFDDGALLSLSEKGELFQWKHVGGEPADSSAAAAAATAADDAAYDSDIEHELGGSCVSSGGRLRLLVQPSPDEPYPVAEWDGGNSKFNLVRSTNTNVSGEGGESGKAGSACLGSHHMELHAPSGYASGADSHEAPPDELQLEWVYGCRGHDAHGSVRWTANGEVAFHAAAVGAVYDRRGHSQRFFLGHSNDLLCLCTHPSGLAIATGQAGPTALSCVWDARTCETISVLRGVHSIGVSALAFDGNGDTLATCGLEASHRVAIWDWRRGLLISRVAVGAPLIFALAFRLLPFALGASATTELAVVGVRTAAFISGLPDPSGPNGDKTHGVASAALRCKRGVWGGRATATTLLCVVYSGDASSSNECYTGTARGDILVWRDRTLARSVSAHAGPVFTLARASGDVAASAAETEVFFSAGKGGKLRRWGGGLRLLGSIDLREPFAALTDAWGRPLVFRCDTAVRSIDVDGAGRILLGTSAGEIAVLSPSSGDLSLLLQGHSARRGAGWPGALAALAAHPSKSIAATAGAEGSLRLWSLTQHCLLASRPLRAAATAAAFSPDGAFLAVGLADGGWILLDANSLKPSDHATAAAAAPTGEHTAHGEVGCLSFSPDGAMLAVGTDGGVTICAHAAGGWRYGWHRVASCVGHASTVQQIDWSEEPVVLSCSNRDVGAGSGSECWLLRSSASPANGSAAMELRLVHWEVMCDREPHSGDGAATVAGTVGFEGSDAKGVTAQNTARAVSSAGARKVAHAAAVRDISWASETCSLCWGATGPASRTGLAFDADAPDNNLRPVCRSHDGGVLAASDARGGVSLWRWPAASQKALCKRYGGHARPPASLTFSHDDTFLVTCGGADLTLLQWRHAVEECSARLVGAMCGDDHYDSDVVADFVPVDALIQPPRMRGKKMNPSRRAFLEASSLAQAARASGAEFEAMMLLAEPSPLGAVSNSTSLVALDELVQKQRFRAVRPWLRGLAPPSSGPPLSERAPGEALELSWVHGVRTHDVRSSVHITALGEVVYPAAAMVVLLSPGGGQKPQQRHYRGHTSAVSAIALHPNRIILASAALGADPAIHVWDSHSLETLASLRGAHAGGVAALAFSTTDEGGLLASCDITVSPLVALWDWRKGQLLGSARAGRRRVLGLAFSPSGLLVSYGAGSLRFWTADRTKLTSRRGGHNGSLAADGSSRTILCVAFVAGGDMCYAGTIDGCVQRWSVNGQCEEVISLNRQQPIFSIHWSDEGLLAAGKGGRLLWWAGDRPPSTPFRASDARVFDLAASLGAAVDDVGRPLAYLTGRAPCVRAISASKDQLVLATRGGELWRLPLPWHMPFAPFSAADSGAPLSTDATALAPPQLLVQGHSAPRNSHRRGEATALATDPSNGDLFASGGDDGSVRVWSISRHRMISMRVLLLPVTSLSYTSDGAHIAAGCAGGGVHVLHADSLADALVFSLAADAAYATSMSTTADSGIMDRLGWGAIFTVASPIAQAAAGVSKGDTSKDISSLSFSPDDTLLAVGSGIGSVEILAVGGHYRRLRTCVGHSAPVLHIDWSSDGEYMQRRHALTFLHPPLSLSSRHP